MKWWKRGKRAGMAEVQGGVLPLQELEIGLPQSVPGTDNQLVRDFISGNDAAFTLLVSKYKDSLTNYLNVMVGNYDVAADLAQETFLRVYKNIGRYSNIYQFSTWLYRIATNLAIDEMRYRKRRGQVFYNNVWDNGRADDSGRPE